ncbi:Putative thiolase-like protein type 1, additional [Septoria linicola]|uniref:Thiolase-like protein type 1, additional n=1 Tax=Septoria linicola TaxID=215465 RepID=A0A9Q9EIU7_9PEZI|nr:putative thiolase-like protein type 1, additional [Septoria linicola]USW53146.1 Putative thiolase-like protein type 1, additional [Septoria linicola]
MSRSQRRTPVIIGVGDVVNRSKKVEDAIEPLQLMIQAIQKAIQDTGLAASALSDLQSSIDSVSVVKTWTWPADYPSLLASKLSFKPLHAEYSDHGGNQPAKLVDEAARRISLGENKFAIVTGAEALASLTACAAAQKMPPPGWTPPSEDVRSVFSPTTRELQAQTYGAKHGCGNPIQLYPLYENAFRAHRGQSITANHQESAEMYADFAAIASQNENAWSYPSHPETQSSIATISSKNRMICFPYPLLMNAFNTVNCSAAVLLTSTEHARELGIAESTWVYPLGGAGTADSYDFWKRAEYWWSPCISRSLDAALDVANINVGDVDLYDVYSCFPIVPKLAAEHLGLPTTTGPEKKKELTLLGGLTSFGGAGNNYSMHALTEMTRQIRRGKGKTGLVLANGGWVTYQHVLLMSRSPRSDGLPYPDENPLEKSVGDVFVPEIVEQAEGECVVETYTVEFARDGSPSKGFVIGRLLKNAHRFLANHADAETLKELSSWEIEPIGRRGWVRAEQDGRNVFTFTTPIGKTPARL